MTLFSRRKKKSLEKRLTDFFWPKIGWRKTFEYYKKKLFRISDSPYSIAAGIACGVSMSFTPFIGFHLIFTAVFCYIVGGNILSGFIGTLIGNPSTFPFIWIGIYFVGAFLTGQTADLSLLSDGLSIDLLSTYFFQIFMPMALGGLLIGALLWPLVYYPLERIISQYQKQRRDKIKRRRKSLRSSDSKGQKK